MKTISYSQEKKHIKRKKVSHDLPGWSHGQTRTIVRVFSALQGQRRSLPGTDVLDQEEYPGKRPETRTIVCKTRSPKAFPWRSPQAARQVSLVCSSKTRTNIRVIPRHPGSSAPNPNIFRRPPGTQHAKKAEPEGPTPKNPNILHKTPGISPNPDPESPRLPPETVLYARLWIYLLSSAISTTSFEAGVMSFILR